MADNGRWFKLWVSALTDPDLDNLDIADFGRWAKFGTYLKGHGNTGTIELSPPCRSLCAKMQINDFNELIKCISKFPNCTVSSETNAIVTWHNWLKYQGDFSTDRVRKFRTVKRAKRRGEEKRREYIGKTPFTHPSLEEITAYCKERNNGVNPQTFLSHYQANGWKVGKNPMKDWRAAVRTWEANNPPKEGRFRPTVTPEWKK